MTQPLAIRPRLFHYLAVTLRAAVVGFAMLLPGRLLPQCADGSPPPCRVAPRPPPAMSIAVLDFETLSRDSADSYLSAGLVEELTSRLGQVTRLSVISRAAVRRVPHIAQLPLAEVGRTLNVVYLVNGSVRRSGPRLRVNAELLRAASGEQVWSGQFDESQQDLLGIQEAVATAVATAVAGRLLPGERRTLSTNPTRSADAYADFLRGRTLYRSAATRAQYFEAAAYLQHALAVDSSFAAAWAELSLLSSRMFWFYIDRTASRLQQASAAANRALVLAPNSPDAHLALGYYYYWGRRDYQNAMQEFSKALALRPSSPDVHAAIANVSRRQGNLDQAIASRTRALELDPGRRTDFLERGLTHHFRRELDEAERDYVAAAQAPAPDVNGHIFIVAAIIERDGSVDRARRGGWLDSVAARAQYFIEQSFHDPSGSFLAWRAPGPHQDAALRAPSSASPEAAVLHQLVRGEILASRGAPQAAEAYDSARTLVERLVANRPDDDGFHMQLAMALAGLGRCDDALREGEKATTLLPISADALTGTQRLEGLTMIEAHCGRLDAAFAHLSQLIRIPAFITAGSLRADPGWARLRSDPRFAELVR